VSVGLDRSEAPATLRLEGSLTIGEAAELKAALLEALGRGGALRISLAGLTTLDVTAIQLLFAAEQAARRADRAWGLAEPMPENLRAMVLEAGFGRLPLAETPGGGTQ